MAHDLLCKWLNLPQHPWPPDHYALLGIDRGTVTTDEIEQRVLERMENLRHYQLMHPDAVTEGMNLLAQAMNSLTDPSARSEYDRGIGVKAETSDDAPEIDEDDEAIESPPIELPPPHPKSNRPTARAPAPPPPPSRIRDEIEEPSPEPMMLLELDDETEAVEELEVDSLEIPRAIFKEEAKEDPNVADIPHRKLYREIARIRRVRRVWQQMQGYLDNATRTFSRRTDTVAFMNVLSDLRPLLASVDDLIGNPYQPGNLIAALTKQQLVVEMFRSLLPSQREALAKDSRAALTILDEHYLTLRREVQQLTGKGFKRRIAYPLYWRIARNPEWLLLFISLAALAIAFVRSVPK